MKTRRDASLGHEKAELMGRDSIWRLLMRFSGPAVIAALVSASYNLVDAIFVGFLGPDALAALAVANPLMTIYWSIGSGIAVGATSLIARFLGSQDREKTSRTFGCSITLFFIMGTLASVFFITYLDTVLRLFGADDVILSLVKRYMIIETVFIPLNFLLIILAELVRVQGSPVVSSVAMIVSGLMNCIWDPVLIFGIGPFPVFGIAGAALATSIGRAIGALILISYLALGKTSYQFRFNYFFPNPRIVADIYRVGLSMTVRTNSMSLSQIIAARAAVSFGVIPLAVLGVLYRISSFVFMPCVGIGQGMLPLVGYNLGAQNKARVGEIVVKASLCGLVWGSLCWMGAMIFPTQVMSIFGTEPDYLAVATPAFRIFAMGFLIIGLQIILGSFFQGIGKGLLSLAVASSRQLIFLTPCLLTLPNVFGLAGVWAAYPISDFSSIAFTLLLVGIAFRGLRIPFRIRAFSDSSEPKRLDDIHGKIDERIVEREKIRPSSVVLDRDEWHAFTADLKRLIQIHEALPARQNAQKTYALDSHHRLLCSYCGAKPDIRDRYCRICGRRAYPPDTRKHAWEF